MKDLDALIAEAEAAEEAAREALLAEGEDAAQLDAIAEDAAVTHEPTPEQRKAFARIYRGMVGLQTSAVEAARPSSQHKETEVEMSTAEGGSTAEGNTQPERSIELSSTSLSCALKDKLFEAVSASIGDRWFLAPHRKAWILVIANGTWVESEGHQSLEPRSCAGRLAYAWSPAPMKHFRMSLDEALLMAQLQTAIGDHLALQAMVLHGCFEFAETSRLTASTIMKPSQIEQIVYDITCRSQDRWTSAPVTTQPRLHRESPMSEDPS
ncbi:hypothetical protein [Sorangium sp. So ce1097]|uniref:hypothetical protein n=1 Tax=Sorangium sp. So ce1097 TaxID=3133330 RepID=UPI003F627EF5